MFFKFNKQAKLPVIGYRANQFILVDNDKAEKMPTMAIGSGQLMGDASMPRLQFRSWMGDASTENAINRNEVIMPRSDLEVTFSDVIVEPEVISKIPDPDQVDYMTKSMLTFVLGSVALFLAAMLLILLVFVCVRFHRRRQARQEAVSNENKYEVRKHLVYPVRSLDIPRRQLNEILSRADPTKANPLDF